MYSTRMRIALLDRRIAIVVRLEADERLASGLVTAAALVAASVLCVAAAPPRLGGVSLFGTVLLVAGTAGLTRLLKPAGTRMYVRPRRAWISSYLKPVTDKAFTSRRRSGTVASARTGVRRERRRRFEDPPAHE